MKIYSDIACVFINTLVLWNAGGSLLVTSIRPQKCPRGSSGPCPGGETTGDSTSRNRASFPTHFSAGFFYHAIICSSLSRRREPHSPRFARKNPPAQRAGQFFRFLMVSCVPDGAVDIGAESPSVLSALASRRKKNTRTMAERTADND